MAFVLLTLLAGTKPASADVYSDLYASQAEHSNAQLRLTDAERQLQRLDRAAGRISERSKAAALQADKAEAEVQATEDELTTERLAAKATVDQMIADYSKEKEDRKSSRAAGIGVGLAFLLFAALTWFFLRIKRSRPVQKMVDEEGSRKVPIIAIGLMFLISLALFGAGSALTAIGGFLFAASIGLAIYLIILVVKAGKPEEVSEAAKSGSRRWLIPALTLIFLLLFVGLTGSSAVAPGPSKPEPPVELLQAARDATGDPAEPPNEALRAAQEAAVAPTRKAEALRQAELTAEAATRSARRAVRSSSAELRRTGRAVRRNSLRVAQAEAAARRAAARQAAADAAAAAAAEAATIPSYSSCATAPSNIPVPPGSDLDADGDGIGCES